MPSRTLAGRGMRKDVRSAPMIVTWLLAEGRQDKASADISYFPPLPLRIFGLPSHLPEFSQLTNPCPFLIHLVQVRHRAAFNFLIFAALSAYRTFFALCLPSTLGASPSPRTYYRIRKQSIYYYNQVRLCNTITAHCALLLTS